MVIYHYVGRIWRILVTPIFNTTYMIINRYYADEPVNINIQSLINIIQDNSWVITNKKGKGKLPLFSGNRERVNSIYAGD